jgi:galactokinase
MSECDIRRRGPYEVSIRELDVLVEAAQNLKGCYGAPLTGAGFGGCTVNPMKRDHADEFVRTLGRVYQDNCVYKAEIYICKASDGAKLL